MSIQSNFPALDPTLLLDFANVKALDPRVTFTRASTGTFYGTQTAKAEENLFLNSQTFQTNWTVARVTVTTDTTAAPDGTTTADTITNTTATGAHAVDQASNTSGYLIVSGLPYTISVFAKKSTNDFFQITTFNASNTLGTGRANFNLATGAAGTVDGGTSTITDVGNGWYRCTYTVTASASGTVNIYFGIITTSTAARFESYTGLGTEAVFIWGAQMEQRSTATAYTATTTQPITNYIPQLLTAASGVARFEHNPITFESLGLEIEEQRTNLVTYSEQFDNAAWTKVRSSITANTIVAPDGTLTGDKLVENTDTNSHYVLQDFSQAGVTTYTATVYAKAGERRWLRLVGSTTSNADARTANFDLVSGGLGTLSNATATITPVGNGWYRCSITFTSSADATYRFSMWLLNDSQGASYTGNGFNGLFIWGAQLEAGAFPTSYIQTVASQVTRAADAASMTGTNFSSWYNQAAGTLYTEWQKFAPSTFQAVAIASDGSNSNAIAIGHGSISGVNNNLRLDVVAGNVSQASIITISNSPSNTFAKTAAAFAVNDFSVVSNGGSAGTDTSGVLPVVNRLSIGASAVGTSAFLNGTIRKIAYYPLRVTNANLQALTS
jgi:hypothetical protein